MVKVAIFMSTGQLYQFLYSEDVGSGLRRNVSETIRSQILKNCSTQNWGVFNLSLIYKFASLLYALLEFILEIFRPQVYTLQLTPVKLYVIRCEGNKVIRVVSAVFVRLFCLPLQKRCEDSMG
jgi:hypothetical protein